MTKAEQYIQDYQRGCSNELVSVESNEGKKVISYYPWLTPDQARRAVEIAREETIDKACEWLNQFDAYRLCLEGHKDYFIEKFRKAMEE